MGQTTAMGPVGSSTPTIWVEAFFDLIVDDAAVGGDNASAGIERLARGQSEA